MLSESTLSLGTLQNAFDQAVRACYRQACRQVSAGTMAELHRHRIAVGTSRASGHGIGIPAIGWARGLAVGVMLVACMGIGLVFVPGSRLDAPPPVSLTIPMLAADRLDPGPPINPIDVLDALDSINLTALDEDSEFLDWLASDEARPVLDEATSLVMQ